MPGPTFFSLSTTLPPPCQAVALNHSALSAASGGSSFTVMLTLRLGGGAASLSVTVALVPGPPFIGSANANSPITAIPASAGAQRGWGGGCWGAPPEKPP